MIAQVSGLWTAAPYPASELRAMEFDDAGYRVDFEAQQRAADESRRALLRRAASLSIPGTHLGPQTFKTFAVKTENRDAFEVAQRAALGSFSGWIHGPIGVGKSHLAKCVLKAARDRGLPAIMTTVETILSKIRSTYDSEGDSLEWYVKACYAEVPVLIIDDLGKEYLKEWGGVAIFDIVNRRAELGAVSPLPVFITSNQSFSDTARLFGARFEGNPTLGIGIVDRLRQLAGGDDNIAAIAGSSRRGAA